MMRPALLFALVCAAGLAGASPPAVFSVHDLDRDGYLSPAEFAALAEQCAQRRGERCRAALSTFEALDTDRDGRIGEAELLDTLARRYRGGLGPRHGPPPKRQELTP